MNHQESIHEITAVEFDSDIFFVMKRDGERFTQPFHATYKVSVPNEVAAGGSM